MRARRASRSNILRTLLGRLAIINLLALLPLAILVILQVRDFEVKSLEAQRNAAFAHTVTSAQPQITLISRGQSLARALAATMQFAGEDLQACQNMMRKVGQVYPEYSLIAFIETSGLMSCSSTGETHDFSQTRYFERLLASSGSAQVLNRQAPVSRVPVIGTSYPVHDLQDNLIGIVTVSVPHAQPLQAAIDQKAHHLIDTLDVLVTFDPAGNMLTTSIGDDDIGAHLPQGHTLNALATQGEQSFIGLDGQGETRIFSVVKITEELWVLGSWAPKSTNTLLPAHIAPYVLVIFITVSGLIAAAFAADQLVVRHVRLLGSSMMTFALNRKSADPPVLVHPPSEIADLARTYAILLKVLRRDEKAMASLLGQKEQLLRELHHRTGNSLQLIASILRMHIRESKDEALSTVLRHLLERIMSLSTVHLGLYKVAGKGGIAMDTLLHEVIGKVDNLHRAQYGHHTITSDLSPLQIATHQAVPLALLVTEVLSSFLTALNEASHEQISLHLEAVAPQLAELRIIGPIKGEPHITGHGGDSTDLIAARLIRSFVRQLDGAMTIDVDETRLYFKIQFQIQGLKN